MEILFVMTALTALFLILALISAARENKALRKKIEEERGFYYDKTQEWVKSLEDMRYDRDHFREEHQRISLELAELRSHKQASDLHVEFVSDLSSALRKNNRSQKEVSRAILAEPSYVAAIINGRIKPSVERLTPLMYEAGFPKERIAYFNEKYLPTLQNRKARRRAA